MARQAGRSSSLCRRPATPPDLRRGRRVCWPPGPSAMPSRRPGASRPPSGRCPAARRGPPGPRAPAQRLGRERSAPPHDAQVVLDFGQREAERLGVLDRAEETDRVLVVTPVPARRPGGLGQQAAALVVAQRLDVDAGPLGRLSGSLVSIMNPYSGTGIKPLYVVTKPPQDDGPAAGQDGGEHVTAVARGRSRRSRGPGVPVAGGQVIRGPRPRTHPAVLSSTGRPGSRPGR